MHAWRSAIGVFSLGAWFYAIAHLPLATAMTLNYMSSVWIAAFRWRGFAGLEPRFVGIEAVDSRAACADRARPALPGW